MNPQGKKKTVTFIVLVLLLLLSSLSPAHLAASALTLAWDPNAEADLNGYKIYYGKRSGNYGFVIDVGNVTRYTVTGLDPETRYYFALTAYDNAANESDFSGEVSAVTGPSYRLISGLGETSEGWIEAFTEGYSHEDWLRVTWGAYNSANGEARIATGDIDGDGRDEIIVGLGPVGGDASIPGGWFELLDDDYTHLAWGRINWGSYNSANGESWPACGDVDGDGVDEIVIGLGSGGGGWFEVFDYTGGSVVHTAWVRVNWSTYNNANGETRPACGDIDGDGYDEIIIGLGNGSGGWFVVFDYDAANLAHTAWGRVSWSTYNNANGETRPACGDIDGDGYDEIIIGLGNGSGGWFEVFDYTGGSVVHTAWGRVSWSTYNNANGETRPACGDIDGDGKDEIVIGLGLGGGGWVEVIDDAAGGYAHLAWPQVHYGSYNQGANGETWPVVKR
jgi:hypothetical protein